LQEGAEVVHHVGIGIGKGVWGSAVVAVVGRDDPVVFGEAFGHGLQVIGKPEQAVEKQYRPALAELAVVELHGGLLFFGYE